MMKTKSVVVMLSVILALPGAALADDRGVDLSGVKEVHIDGDASMIRLTAAAEPPYGMTLTTRYKGWLSGWQSGWFFTDCAGASEVDVDGGKLSIDVVASSWYWPSDCVVDLEMTVPPNAAVAISQSASMVQLAGDFSELTASGSALDLSLDGHAARSHLSGSAMRARLSFARLDQTEEVTISADALLADLDFGPEAQVNYTVSGAANFVDSRLENRADGGIKVKIDGSFVRATIR